MSTIKNLSVSENINSDASPNKGIAGKLIRPFLLVVMLTGFTILLTSCWVGGRGYGYHNHRHDRQNVGFEHHDNNDRH